MSKARTRKRAREVDRLRAVALAQRVVQEAVQDVPFLDRRPETVEERVLRRVVDDPVGAGDQELRRNRDRGGVRDDAIGGLLQTEEDVDRDPLRQQRIGVVARDAARIARQEARLHIARDECVSAKFAQELEPRQRERHVELHAERRGGETMPRSRGA
jgi:hypothetical protein